jgi:peptidoglycan/LPS O-acetylase OafA/YrhL
VLSGFLIASRYSDEISQQSFRWRPYLIRRVARILPMYYVVLLIIVLWGVPIGWSNLTLTQSLFPNLWGTGIGAAWTLTLEEMFYLLLPIILWVMWRANRPWRMLVIVAIISIGLYELVEKPTHKWILRRFDAQSGHKVIELLPAQ